jgi:hypothetical protein
MESPTTTRDQDEGMDVFVAEGMDVGMDISVAGGIDVEAGAQPLNTYSKQHKKGKTDHTDLFIAFVPF